MKSISYIALFLLIAICSSLVTFMKNVFIEFWVFFRGGTHLKGVNERITRFLTILGEISDFSL